jgi:hypothetical protein
VGLKTTHTMTVAAAEAVENRVLLILAWPHISFVE